MAETTSTMTDDERQRYARGVSVLKKMNYKRTGVLPDNPFDVETPTGQSTLDWWKGMTVEEQTVFINENI